MFQVFDADPIPIGIALMAAFLCIGAGFRELRAGERDRVVAAWWGFALAMLAIATAHLWNLGGGVAESGRDVFRFEGLYGSRRPIQAAVVMALIAGAMVASPFAFRWVRRHLGERFLLPATVLGGLAGFLAIRTISLHAIDAWLYGKHILGGHPGSIIEVLGLVAFVVAAFLAVNSGPSGASRPNPPAGSRERPSRAT